MANRVDVGIIDFFWYIYPDGVVSESAVDELLFGAAFFPSLVNDSIHGDREAGAISAVAAMDEDGFGRVANRAHGVEYVFIPDVPGDDWEMNQVQTGLFFFVELAVELGFAE